MIPKKPHKKAHTPTVHVSLHRHALACGLFGLLVMLFAPARAAIPTAAIQDPRYDLGYLVVTYYSGVDPAGVQDSTAGIQQAIDDARDNSLAVFFPNQSNGNTGVYIISDTLRCFSYRLWNTSKGNVNSPKRDEVPLIGSSLGNSRPVIKLANSASSFDNVNKVKPMLAFRVYSAMGSCGTQPPTSLPANAFDDPSCFESTVPAVFNWSLRNLDFDCNGHSGSVGVSFPGAQRTFMGDVRIDATGAYAGIIGMPGLGASGKIEVEGGLYGVKTGPYGDPDVAPGTTAGGGTSANGTPITGLKLFNQTSACIVSEDSLGNLVIAGFHFKPATNAVAIEVNSEEQTARGPLCLVDGIVEMPAQSGDTALPNAAGKSVYFRNVYVTNTDDLIQSGSQSVIDGSGTWKRIREYAYTDQANPPAGDPPYEQGDNVVETFNVINGTVSRSPAEPATDIENNASAPPADLISRHVWNSLPSFEDGTITDATHGIGTFVNVVDEGATAVTTHDAIVKATDSAGGNDDTAAFQAAIDAAWDNGNGHGRVLVPRGGFQISDTLTLRPNTTFFGVGLGVSSIGVHSSWEPTTGSPYMIQTVDDANATTFMGFLTLDIRTKDSGGGSGLQSTDRFSHVLWRAGRHSETIQWYADYQFRAASEPTNPRVVFAFTGNGGGRHYNIFGMDRYTGNADFRNILVSGTNEPLWIYGCNVEATKDNSNAAETNIEVTNAANVRLLGFKREGQSPTLIVNNSTNVALFGHEDRDEIGLGGTLQVLGDSDNVLIAIVNDRRVASAPSGKYVLREAITGESVVTVPYPEAISIYKRGELNDSAVYIPGAGAGGGAVGDFSVAEDIGSPALAGSASYNSGTETYTVTGAGEDIYGTSDQFQFVHESWTGDGRIIARVASQTTPPTHNWAKAGVMFRESTAAGARNVDLIVAPNPSVGGTVQMLSRATTSGTTAQVGRVDGKAMPYWVRLERNGNIFTGWHSLDGLVWFVTGSTTLALNNSTRAGLAVTSHDTAELNTGTFTGVNLTDVPAWTAADIGSVGATGSTTVNHATDVFTLNGAGANIFGAADSFHFNYIEWTAGDATIVAEVTSVENTHKHSKGGLMIRQSLADDAAHATVSMKSAASISPAVEVLRRTSSGGSTGHSSGSPVASLTPPRFLKLVRSGNTFTAYHSADAVTWTQAASSESITMTGTVYIGLVSCSIINTSDFCTATFESVFVK